MIIRSKLSFPGAAAAFVGAYDAIPNIVTAYSTRRLLTAYTGSLLRIRRSSDNAEQDFGYDGSGNLDTAAVATFIGAGSGNIMTWYDQSGSGHNATQATHAERPLYVASGQNGRPVLRFDDTDFFFYPEYKKTFITILAVAQSSASGRRTIVRNGFAAGSSLEYLLRIEDETLSGIVVNQDGNVPSPTFATVATAATWSIHGMWWDGSTVSVNRNGGAPGTSTLAGTSIYNGSFRGRIGAGYTSNSDTAPRAEFWDGDMAEIIICDVALSTSDREAAETAANDYWGLF
jgi:hypothetical protein